VTNERLTDLKALGSIASGVAVPELIAEIERLRAVIVSLMLEAEPDPDLGESVESLMRKDVPTDAPVARGMGSRKMNWPRVQRENKMAKNPLPKMPQAVEDGRAELSPEERLESKRAARESRRTIKPTVSAKAKYRTDFADLAQLIMADPEMSAAILDAKK